jgi:hypothetical protein
MYRSIGASFLLSNIPSPPPLIPATAAELKCKAGRIELQILHCNMVTELLAAQVDAAPSAR